MNKQFFKIKYILLTGIACALFACTSSTKTEPETVKDNGEGISYSKNDLNKIKWIEGKWRGMAGNSPFYEIYEIINDSTLRITSYEWDGKDSSKSSVDLLQWRTGGYYLGKDQNYKVTDITDSEIKMIPIKASNDILWRSAGDSGWVAILGSNKGSVTYYMKQFDPFKK